MPIEAKEGIQIYLVKLGEIGKSSNAYELELNSNISSFIPKLEEYLEQGKLKPMEYDLVGNVGVEEVLPAFDAFNAKKSGDKKIVVRIATD